VLCGVQAVTVLLPRRHARGEGSVFWLVVPAAALALGVAVLRLAAGGPHALALLAAVATPALAGAGPAKAPLAAALWLLAWLAPFAAIGNIPDAKSLLSVLTVND